MVWTKGDDTGGLRNTGVKTVEDNKGHTDGAEWARALVGNGRSVGETGSGLPSRVGERGFRTKPPYLMQGGETMGGERSEEWATGGGEVE